mmetsp:Transcript_33177/g.59382  ORF Transcript_33177/g.59382 Transcript_33177/m.59382 type:complete len:182 (+) Transcript_33177:3988-4533(+)
MRLLDSSNIVVFFMNSKFLPHAHKGQIFYYLSSVMHTCQIPVKMFSLNSSVFCVYEYMQPLPVCERSERMSSHTRRRRPAVALFDEKILHSHGLCVVPVSNTFSNCSVAPAVTGHRTCGYRNVDCLYTCPQECADPFPSPPLNLAGIPLILTHVHIPVLLALIKLTPLDGVSVSVLCVPQC